MPKMKVNLFDQSFAHETSSVAGKEAKLVDYNRGRPDLTVPSWYTNTSIYSRPVTDPNHSYGWITEPPSITPTVYLNINKVLDQFKWIFTYYQPFLDQRPDKFKLIVQGGIWIGGRHGGGKIEIADKSKNVSMLCSPKVQTAGHQARLNLAKKLQSEGTVHVYGLDGYAPLSPSITPYRYSVVVENEILDNFITEKFCNVVAVGGIPVYRGAKNVDKFFNSEGIIQFETDEELLDILPALTEERYQRMLPAIQDNFERVKNFEITEDRIVREYFNV